MARIKKISNSIIGNSQRNIDYGQGTGFDKTDAAPKSTGPKKRLGKATSRKLPTAQTTARERASRPAYAENTNTLRVANIKKKKTRR